MQSKTIPEKSGNSEEILKEMESFRGDDVNWREGQVWCLVFDPGEEIAQFLKKAYTMYFSENGLNPAVFPSLRRFEIEVVSMVGQLLGGSPPRPDSSALEDSGVVGNMTSGGTESILMAIKAAREWSRERGIRRPEMVLPVSAHPAFEKGAHYFDVTPVHVPVRKDLRADVTAMKRAITKRTILLVGSAPAYPHGVIDPIDEIGALAQQKGLLFHVDACVGGLALPFVREAGYPLPPFDFSVPGVTSMSADLHKYGYAPKGASLVLYRNARYRRYQYFAYIDWPGGIYVSPTMTGTRPGGAIAGSWAVLNRLGKEGYVAIAREVMETAKKIQRGVADIDGLKVLGEPDMSVMAIAGEGSVDIYEAGDFMSERGWHMDRQQFPPCLHLTVSRGHVKSADRLLEDFRQAAEASRKPLASRALDEAKYRLTNTVLRAVPAGLATKITEAASSLMGDTSEGIPKRSAPMYGMMAALPNRGDLKQMVIDIFDKLTRPEA